MDVENIIKNIHQEDGLGHTLGVEFISAPEDDTLKTGMAVDDHNKRPFGSPTGGASSALTESLAGIGSMALCPEKTAMGINVHGNYVKTMPYGRTITAYGKLIHRGHTLRVQNIDTENGEDGLISGVQITNYVIAPQGR